MTHGDSRWLMITSEHFYRWNFQKIRIFAQKRGNLEKIDNWVDPRSIWGRIEVKSGGQIWPLKKYIFPKLVFFETLENIFEYGNFFVIFENPFWHTVGGNNLLALDNPDFRSYDNPTFESWQIISKVF